MNLRPHPARPAAGAGFADPLLARVAAVVHREAGIVMGPDKVGLMQARLARRMAATGCRDLASYVALIDGAFRTDELPHLVSAMTTNVTQFFREAHHFDFLRDSVFPAFLDRPGGLRIWSAGCSSGQEPYSIAICAHRAGIRASITATDIDTAVLVRAEAGIYSDDEIASIPPLLRQACLQRVAGGWQLGHALRETVLFRALNLHSLWDFQWEFDVIFCRNVVIYFDPVARLRLWVRFMQNLRPGGWLFVGHSERIPEEMRHRLKPVGITVYQHAPDRARERTDR